MRIMMRKPSIYRGQSNGVSVASISSSYLVGKGGPFVVFEDEFGECFETLLRACATFFFGFGIMAVVDDVVEAFLKSSLFDGKPVKYFAVPRNTKSADLILQSKLT